ncbi:DsbA family oxidoreductase [Arcticibacterium luteifluviistationis]|uniref:Disulfide bond formation protein DsbA n=1 Tax=Arcticibacterium luteifluviistationis TaxID=1784714 RepID=A0A2Z4GEA4_9BACT|nr:DsbA family oxidoreductase [Arcticibacterium luteifluviistationis]AWV99524.1 disulfide bond formation protein DsbA [Arcticibacterium luteifluviistationis]
MKKKINIDIVSDIACPWCFVGKRRLEEAIKSLDKYDLNINWHPFQLDPNIPQEGADKEEYMANKFGSVERYEMLAENLISAGDGVGISFDFKSAKTIPNTMKMHQLLHVASKEGFADSLKERLFKANFEEVLDLTQDATLVNIMKEFDWTEEYTLSVINDQEIAYWVTQEIRNYQQMGVTGVPFFIFNNKYAFSGAQPPQVFIDTIKDVSQKMEVAKAESCDIDDPNC